LIQCPPIQCYFRQGISQQNQISCKWASIPKLDCTLLMFFFGEKLVFFIPKKKEKEKVFNLVQNRKKQLVCQETPFSYCQHSYQIYLNTLDQICRNQNWMSASFLSVETKRIQKLNEVLDLEKKLKSCDASEDWNLEQISKNCPRD